MKSERVVRFLFGLLTCMTFVGPSLSSLQVAENGSGFYLLSSNTSMAGAMPPGGPILASYDYYYGGDASGNAASDILLDQTGARLDLESNVDLDAHVYIKLPGALWVAPRKVLDGGLGLGGS